MPRPVSLSQSKLSHYRQCRRRLWLEQYSPELEELSVAAKHAFSEESTVHAAAREVFGQSGSILISSERGLRSAIEQTAEALSSTDGKAIFKASFEHEGLVVQVDILDRSQDKPSIYKVVPNTAVAAEHIADCAAQAWALAGAGIETGQVLVAHINPEFAAPANGDCRGLFTAADVTTEVEQCVSDIDAAVASTRDTLQLLEQPEASVGAHCDAGHGCPFLAHCLSSDVEFSLVASSGTAAARVGEWLERGYSRFGDVPFDDLVTPRERLIWQCAATGKMVVDAHLKHLIASLSYPRYYVDAGVARFAVPRWPNTRPFERLPYQWSCHVEKSSAVGSNGLLTRSFLDFCTDAGMRAWSEQLIAGVGRDGPVVVHGSALGYALRSMADRFTDLATQLIDIERRIVDIGRALEAGFYHPEMAGSWSVESILKVTSGASEPIPLERLAEPLSDQATFIDAIDPNNSESRRRMLLDQLEQNCLQRSLAVRAIVERLTAMS